MLIIWAVLKNLTFIIKLLPLIFGVDHNPLFNITLHKVKLIIHNNHRISYYKTTIRGLHFIKVKIFFVTHI